jgi:hypothetical protein
MSDIQSGGTIVKTIISLSEVLLVQEDNLRKQYTCRWPYTYIYIYVKSISHTWTIASRNGEILNFFYIECNLEKTKFEDTKQLIRIRKASNAMAKRKRTNGQTMVYKTLHIKLKLSNHSIIVCHHVTFNWC